MRLLPHSRARTSTSKPDKRRDDHFFILEVPREHTVTPCNGGCSGVKLDLCVLIREKREFRAIVPLWGDDWHG